MSLINATYTFNTPTSNSTGGSITVVGNSNTEIKAAVLAQLEARKSTAQGTVDALNSAEAALNS